jgi:hypothetical protein
MFFNVGPDPSPQCFSNGWELYGDSRIELSPPGGSVAATMPDDFIQQPANMEVMPIRGDDELMLDGVFGDYFDGDEVDPDLGVILASTPVMDGYIKLCNADLECDELSFTLESSPP